MSSVKGQCGAARWVLLSFFIKRFPFGFPFRVGPVAWSRLPGVASARRVGCGSTCYPRAAAVEADGAS
jgi:hypothetical protein